MQADFPCTWIHGASDCRRNADPLIQVHQYDPDTFILRQNMCVHFEAPFLYLLFGRDKVFLQDTGATSAVDRFPLRPTVDRLISKWLSDRGRRSIELAVTHSHGHGDHVAADGQFADRPDTTTVPVGAAAVAGFFGITSWPDEVARYDLGGRVLGIVPLPGHTEDHIAVFDERTGILLTGDTLYPGNLFVQDWPSYKASISRLADYCQARKVSHVLGTHIEMTNCACVAYDSGSTYHPGEHELQLSVDHLGELHRALTAMGIIRCGRYTTTSSLCPELPEAPRLIDRAARRPPRPTPARADDHFRCQGGHAPERSMRNMPRPCVTHTRDSAIQNRSNTGQLVGPSFVGDQVAPPSSLVNSPTSVPA